MELMHIHASKHTDVPGKGTACESAAGAGSSPEQGSAGLSLAI